VVGPGWGRIALAPNSNHRVVDPEETDESVDTTVEETEEERVEWLVTRRKVEDSTLELVYRAVEEWEEGAMVGGDEDKGSEDEKSEEEHKGLDFSQYLVKQAKKGEETEKPIANGEEVERKGQKISTEEKLEETSETKKRRPQVKKGEERQIYKETEEPIAKDEEVGRKGQKMSTKEQPTKTRETKKRKPHVSNVKCPRCDKVFSHGRGSAVVRHAKNHLLTHVMDQMAPHLPSSKPYTCSRCGNKHRDRNTLARHLAFVHKAIHELTDITPEELDFS